MEKRNTRTETARTLTWFGGVIVFSAIIIIAVVSWLLYEHTVNLLTENLRERLLSIGITQAANIDPKNILALQKEEDWNKPEWGKIVTRLKKAKDDNSNIVFMYIIRKRKDDPTQMEFVADAESLNPYANTDDDLTNDVDANGDGIIESEGADFLQWPGQEYSTPPQEAFDAYNGPLTNKELYSDSYGEVLTGYAPIKDEKGETIAILATDIKANDFLTVTRQTLYPFLMFIIFLILAIVFLSMTLIKLWNKRVAIMRELDRQKDELLGIVSHQLATPISALKWDFEMLLDGDIGEVKEEQKDFFQKLQGVTAHLSDLVSMILDVSRIQLGRMKVDRTELDLNVFFGDVLNIMEAKAKEHKVDLSSHIQAKMGNGNLDKRLMLMITENLLSNAIKYTPEGGKVKLAVRVENNILKFSVSDTGCGIPKQDQDKIFGKLYRASNVRSVDGNGFGLYVVKGAVEGQAGNITFKSAEGKGTEFFVELPLNIVEKAA